MSSHATIDWVEKAEGNFTSALVLSHQRTRPVPDVVCNQCCQSAEKYLKALLVQYDMPRPKTMDLVRLEHRLAQVTADVLSLHLHLARLNPYGIDVCYPGFNTTVSDAQDAIQAMKAVRKFARAKLGLKP